MKFELENEALILMDGRKKNFKPAKTSFETRKHTPKSIVLMSTCGDSLDGAVNWAGLKMSGFAPHFVIGVNGELVQTLPLNVEGEFAQNKGDFTGLIGVALVNLGALTRNCDNEYVSMAGSVSPNTRPIPSLKYEGGNAFIAYTTAQIGTLTRLVNAIREHSGFLKVCRHEDIDDDGPFSVAESLVNIQLLNGFQP